MQKSRLLDLHTDVHVTFYVFKGFHIVALIQQLNYVFSFISSNAMSSKAIPREIHQIS